MSTQSTPPTPDRVSSILLAFTRMCPSSPEKTLRHLKDPASPNDNVFLDAFAALCSLVPQCESASAVVELQEGSNRLYILTSPSAPQTLRDSMGTWIDLVQKLAGVTPSGHTQTTPEQVIAEIYRSCHGKLLDNVELDGSGKEVQEEISKADKYDLEGMMPQIKIQDRERERHRLVGALEILIQMAAGPERGPATFSAENSLSLHDAVRTIAPYESDYPEYEFVSIAGRLSRAIDTIINFAAQAGTSQTENKHHERILRLPWNVEWLDLPTPTSKSRFVATTDEREVVSMLGKPGKYSGLSRNWGTFEPPKGLSRSLTLEAFPGRFEGNGVMHCESALLHHVIDNQLSVSPYIGSSQPICYACLMLVGAYNFLATDRRQRFAVGPRSTKIANVDVAWAYPPMGDDVYDALAEGLSRDFAKLSEYEDFHNSKFNAPLGIDLPAEVMSVDRAL